MKQAARPVLLSLGLAMIALLGLRAPAALAQASQLETAVKATYLYKLAPFVTWPPGDSTQPFTICIVGADPFGDTLDRAVAGQSFGARPYLIARVETIGPGSTCNVAYIGGSGAQSISAAMRAVHGLPVLTVTDSSDDAGIVDFAVQDGRVRFRIDQRAATENRLVISSKLLNLALSVKGGIRP